MSNVEAEAVSLSIHPLGDEAVVVLFGNTIDPLTNKRVCQFSRTVANAKLPWVRDVVPSFSACAVHYSASKVPAIGNTTPYATVSRELRTLLIALEESDATDAQELIDIPVCYGGANGPDLESIAQAKGVSPRTIIEAHKRAMELRVFMIGFLPGAPYIGLHSALFDVPRRSEPRPEVPWGSVGVANRQTMIYPVDAPGGWNLIGRTPLQLFDVASQQGSLLLPGNRVRFVEVDDETFEALHQSCT